MNHMLKRTSLEKLRVYLTDSTKVASHNTLRGVGGVATCIHGRYREQRSCWLLQLLKKGRQLPPLSFCSSGVMHPLCLSLGRGCGWEKIQLVRFCKTIGLKSIHNVKPVFNRSRITKNDIEIEVTTLR